MKKLVFGSLLLLCCPVMVFARHGGDAALGGLAGGMMGSMVGTAITRDSSSGSSSSSSSFSRELDRLESSLRLDISKLDDRIRSLERSGKGGDASDELKQEMSSFKKSVKKTLGDIESMMEEFGERLDSFEKSLNKIKKNTDDKSEKVDKPEKSSTKIR